MEETLKEGIKPPLRLPIHTHPKKQLGMDGRQGEGESDVERIMAAEDDESVEKMFEKKEEVGVGGWQRQVSVRALVVSFVLSILFTFIVMKLNLTTGIVPSLNVSAGLLGFFLLKTWPNILNKSPHPFTRQENTVIQTCVVASAGIAFSGHYSLLHFHFNFISSYCLSHFALHYQLYSNMSTLVFFHSLIQQQQQQQTLLLYPCTINFFFFQF